MATTTRPGAVVPQGIGPIRTSPGAPVQSGQTGGTNLTPPRSFDLGLGSAFNGFFNAIEARANFEHKEKADQIRRDISDTITHAEAEVAKNPEGAIQALKTGDFTGFVPDEWANRRPVFDAFNIAVARQSAAQDQEKLKATLADTGPTDDLFGVYHDFLKQQTAGSGDVFASEYASTLTPQAVELIGKMHDARRDQAVKDALKTASDVAMHGIKTGKFPTSEAGLTGLRQSYISVIPGSIPEAMAMADAQMEKDLVTAADGGDMRAFAMLSVADPGRSGTSFAERRPDVYEQLGKNNLARAQEVRSFAQLSALNALENLVTGAQAHLNPTSMAQQISMLSDIRDRFETKGAESGRWRSLRDRILSGLKGKAGTDLERMTNVLASLRTNSVIPLSSEDVNKTGLLIYNGALEQLGATPEENAQLSLRYFAEYGAGKELSNFLSTVMTSAVNADQFNQTYSQIATMRGAMPGEDITRILNEDGAAMFEAISTATDAGLGDPASLRDTMREALPNLGNTATYLERQPLDPADLTKGELGKNGVRAFAQAAYEDAKVVSDEGVLWNSRVPWDHVSTEVQDLYIASANRAAAMVAAMGLPPDREHITQIAARLTEGKATLGMDQNGEAIAVRKRTPAIMMDMTTGETKPGREPTIDQFNAMQSDFLATPEPVDVEGWQKEDRRLGGQEKAPTEPNISGRGSTRFLLEKFGGTGGFVTDAGTEAGEGFAVLQPSGFPMMLAPGGKMNLPVDAAGPEASRLLTKTGEEDGIANYVVAAAPTGDAYTRIPLSDHIAAVFNPVDHMWTIRAFPREAGPEDLRPMNSTAASRPDLTPEQKAGFNSQFNSKINDSAVQGGIVSPMVGVDPTASDPEAALDEAIAKSRQVGHMPPGFVTELVDRLNDLNGFSPKATEFASRGLPTSAGPENPTVGYGTNLSHPGLAEAAQKLGINLDKIGRQDARALSTELMRKDLAFLTSLYPNITSSHELGALALLIQSSPWHNNWPDPLDPKLTKALENGDTNYAGDLIGRYYARYTPARADDLLPDVGASSFQSVQGGREMNWSWLDNFRMGETEIEAVDLVLNEMAVLVLKYRIFAKIVDFGYRRPGIVLTWEGGPSIETVRKEMPELGDVPVRLERTVRINT